MIPRIVLLFLIILPVIARRTGGGGGYGGGHRGGTHAYPSSSGLSGTHGGNTYSHNNAYPAKTQGASYPASTGLSGNNQHASSVQRTEIHHHHYNPPQQINYGSGYHPVYHERPPVYVYQYRDSGSRFDTLLTGLALYNLGRMSSHHSHYDSHREYRGNPGEVCKLGVSKSNGEYEETRIDCQLMSSFIWEADQERNRVATQHNTVTTVNVTRVESTSANGTVTVTESKVVDALQVKGPSLQVTPGMNCFMIRISRDSSMLKKKVDCGLLQEYSRSSFRNASWRNLPVITVMISVFFVFL